MKFWTTNEFKAALNTAVFTFFGAAFSALVGLVAAVENWANGGDPTLLDDIDVFVKLMVSAVLAAAVGLLNYLVRWAQTKLNVGTVPVYQHPSDKTS